MSDLLNDIRRLHDQEHTGILTLAHSSGERIQVFFHEGMIEGASSSSGARRLGQYLVQAKYATTAAIEAVALEAQKQNLLLGEAVVRKGLVDRASVATAVRRQALDLLTHALGSGFILESFNGALRSYYVPGRVSFPHLLLELSRVNPAPFQLDADAHIILVSDIDLSIFSWTPKELSVLNELTYPNTLEGLQKITGIPESQLRSLLGTMRKLGILEGVDADDPGESAVPQPRLELEKMVPTVTDALVSERVEVLRNSFSFISEQFNNLKVQLSGAQSENVAKVFTVSSPESQDGKSLVSANLAFSFAQDASRRVIIVDCDLRSPSVQKYLGVTSEPGLLQYLANGHGPNCYMRRVDNLYFMTAGGVAPNPIEALSMRKMKQLIESLRTQFDTIILDAPPFSPIADARLVTGLSDGLIMVVRRGKTLYSSLDRAFKVVDRNKLLGVVFNDVKPMLFHTYHNSSYYRYGHSAYIGSEEPKKFIEAAKE
ncbi:MAG TPA: polysaccharide biosynthesis tyrosine autokinase [Terriglobia bacterium]|nr:polysaccharide biosynthesis tyrosine autokinase [Terriglobia bacterium]